MSYNSLLRSLTARKKSSKTRGSMLYWLRPQEDDMSVSFKNALKRTALFASIVGVGFSQMGCGGDDPVNPKEPGGTDPGPTVGKVFSFQDNGSGGRVYTKDSLVVFRANGSEFTVSVRQADLKKGNNVMVKTSLFSPENIQHVRNGDVGLVNYNLDTEIVSKDTKYLGSSGSDKLEKARISKMGIIGTRRDPNDDNWASITKEEVLGIVKLLDQPVALVGHKALVSGKAFDLKPTN